ncbi:Hypothetical protein CINCED_3A003247, partial [Cinara cedri]
EIVNNHNGAVIVKNKYEEQTMELNMEEENQTNVQSEVVNNHDGAAIDNNKIEEQTMEIDIDEEKSKNVQSLRLITEHLIKCY